MGGGSRAAGTQGNWPHARATSASHARGLIRDRIAEIRRIEDKLDSIEKQIASAVNASGTVREVLDGASVTSYLWRPKTMLKARALRPIHEEQAGGTSVQVRSRPWRGTEMGILGRVSVPLLVGRGASDAKAARAGGKASAAAMEDDAVVAEFRRVLAEMLGEWPPEDSDELEPETEGRRDQDFTEPAHVIFAMNSSEAAKVDNTVTDAYQHGERSAYLSPATPSQEDTADAAEEDQINPASVIEPDAVSQENLVIDEPQTTPASVDRERVRIELKDGRRLEAWRRSSPSIGPQLLILDVIGAFDAQGKEIPSSPADSFTFRSEVIAINGSRIHQVQCKASTLGNPSPNDETPEEKERF